MYQNACLWKVEEEKRVKGNKRVITNWDLVGD